MKNKGKKLIPYRGGYELDLKTVISKINGFIQDQDDIIAAYVFGSLAGGTENAMSDIDIALLMKDTGDIVSRIKELTSSIADILETSTLDLVSLRDSDLALRYNVIRGGLLFFERNSAIRIAFESKTTSEYLDMLPMWRAYDEQMKIRLEGHVSGD